MEMFFFKLPKRSNYKVSNYRESTENIFQENRGLEGLHEVEGIVFHKFYRSPLRMSNDIALVRLKRLVSLQLVILSVKVKSGFVYSQLSH